MRSRISPLKVALAVIAAVVLLLSLLIGVGIYFRTRVSIPTPSLVLDTPAAVTGIPTFLPGRFVTHTVPDAGGKSLVEIKPDGTFVQTQQNSSITGQWTQSGDQLTLAFAVAAYGFVHLKIEDNDHLVGPNIHQNGKQWVWHLARTSDASENVTGDSLTLRSVSPDSVASASDSLWSLPEFSVESARYGTTDLTERMRTAAQDKLLVAFVESDLSINRQTGELSLRLRTENGFIHRNYPNRQFVFLDARPPRPVPEKGFVVLDAFYGTGIWGEGRMIDIKSQMEAQTRNGAPSIPIRQLVSGIRDPAFGFSKIVIVYYSLDGRVHVKAFEEHQSFTIPRN